MILLRPIEPAAAGSMPNAPGATGAVAVDIAQKTVVLQCIQQMCESGQFLVDLFVNYDCDLEGANLFERMVRLNQAKSPLLQDFLIAVHG